MSRPRPLDARCALGALCVLAPLWALSALALLSACTVGPDYQAPEVEAPERFVSQEVLAGLIAGREDEPEPVNWWEGFSDPILNELVEEALESNLRIAGGIARLREARAELALADSGDSPRVGASAGGEVEEARVLDSDADETTIGSLFGALDLIWPLDVFGRTRRRVEAARAALEAAEAELRGFVLDVSSEVAREYLRLRGDQRQLELLGESVALQEKTLSIVRSRYEAGLSPELDLRRAEASVEGLRAQIPPLEESLLNARNRIALLTGRFPGAFEELLREKAPVPGYRGRFAEAVPLVVLARRPDIQQAEAELKQAIADIGVAEADYYPAFALASQITISSVAVEDSSPVDLLVGSLSLLADQVLYDGGAREASVEAAEARAEAALIDYRQALLFAVQEVETSLAAIAASRGRQEALERAVRASALSFGQAENLYQQGLISFLDVVDAQRVLADAEQDLAEERTNLATQVAILFRVLGTDAAAFHPR